MIKIDAFNSCMDRVTNFNNLAILHNSKSITKDSGQKNYVEFFPDSKRLIIQKILNEKQIDSN